LFQFKYPDNYLYSKL